MKTVLVALRRDLAHFSFADKSSNRDRNAAITTHICILKSFEKKCIIILDFLIEILKSYEFGFDELVGQFIACFHQKFYFLTGSIA